MFLHFLQKESQRKEFLRRLVIVVNWFNFQVETSCSTLVVGIHSGIRGAWKGTYSSPWGLHLHPLDHTQSHWIATGATSMRISVARIFSGVGMHFLLDHNLMTFFSHHPLYMVTYVIYCHQLPFYRICRPAPHQIQPHFCRISNKNAYQIFFVTLGGCTCTPWLHLCPCGVCSSATLYCFHANIVDERKHVSWDDDCWLCRLI